MITATIFPSSPPLSTPSHISDNLLSSADVQPHIYNVFTRSEMNRAIIISHANSADNDQKPSPAPLSSSYLPLRLLWGANSGDKPPLLLFHGLFKDLVRPTNHYF